VNQLGGVTAIASRLKKSIKSPFDEHISIANAIASKTSSLNSHPSDVSRPDTKNYRPPLPPWSPSLASSSGSNTDLLFNDTAWGLTPSAYFHDPKL
jgi:hypothetical protein